MGVCQTYSASCLKHKKEALLQDEAFRRVNKMHLKLFGSITLLPRQATIQVQVFGTLAKKKSYSKLSIALVSEIITVTREEASK